MNLRIHKWIEDYDPMLTTAACLRVVLKTYTSDSWGRVTCEKCLAKKGEE